MYDGSLRRRVRRWPTWRLFAVLPVIWVVFALIMCLVPVLFIVGFVASRRRFLRLLNGLESPSRLHNAAVAEITHRRYPLGASR